MDELKKYDNDVEQLFLCKPCIEKMKGMRTLKSIRVVASRKAKGTCEQCCRRRYGYECDVEFNYDLDNESTTKRGVNYE